MLKSLILLLLSVMIFTSCGDNGVEEEDITIAFRFNDNYYVPYTSPSSKLIDKIKNKSVNIKIKDINNQEYMAVQNIEFKTDYLNNIITYKIEPNILIINNNEIIDIVVTAKYNNDNITSSKLDNEIYEPLINNITEIYLY